MWAVNIIDKISVNEKSVDLHFLHLVRVTFLFPFQAFVNSSKSIVSTPVLWLKFAFERLYSKTADVEINQEKNT